MCNNNGFNNDIIYDLFGGERGAQIRRSLTYSPISLFQNCVTLNTMVDTLLSTRLYRHKLENKFICSHCQKPIRSCIDFWVKNPVRITHSFNYYIKQLGEQSINFDRIGNMYCEQCYKELKHTNAEQIKDYKKTCICGYCSDCGDLLDIRSNFASFCGHYICGRCLELNSNSYRWYFSESECFNFCSKCYQPINPLLHTTYETEHGDPICYGCKAYELDYNSDLDYELIFSHYEYFNN